MQRRDDFNKITDAIVADCHDGDCASNNVVTAYLRKQKLHLNEAAKFGDHLQDFIQTCRKGQHAASEQDYCKGFDFVDKQLASNVAARISKLAACDPSSTETACHTTYMRDMMDAHVSNLAAASKYGKHFENVTRYLQSWLALDDNHWSEKEQQNFMENAFSRAVTSYDKFQKIDEHAHRECARQALRSSISDLMQRAQTHYALANTRNSSKTRASGHSYLESAARASDFDELLNVMRDSNQASMALHASGIREWLKKLSFPGSTARKLKEIEAQIREQERRIVRTLLREVARPSPSISDSISEVTWLLKYYFDYYILAITGTSDVFSLKSSAKSNEKTLALLDRYLADVSELLANIHNDANNDALVDHRTGFETLRSYLARLREFHREYTRETTKNRRVEINNELKKLRGEIDVWVKTQSRGAAAIKASSTFDNRLVFSKDHDDDTIVSSIWQNDISPPTHDVVVAATNRKISSDDDWFELPSTEKVSEQRESAGAEWINLKANVSEPEIVSEPEMLRARSYFPTEGAVLNV